MHLLRVSKIQNHADPSPAPKHDKLLEEIGSQKLQVRNFQVCPYSIWRNGGKEEEKGKYEVKEEK